MDDRDVKRRDLPTLERGRDLSRILAFTDGVFAIAITLLVLQIEVPPGLTSNADYIDAIKDMAPDLFAFAISFMVIGVYWVNHHRLMRMVREYDTSLMFVTMLYLFWVVLLPFTSQLIGEYSSKVSLSAVTYILNLALIGVAQMLMIRIILRHKLGDPRYEWDLELSLKTSLYMVAVFLVSAPLALILAGYTPILWLVLLRIDPWQKKREQLYASSDEGGAETAEG